MSIEDLVNQIKEKQSFLCVGLDTDLDKIPKHLLETDDPIFTFNRAIIDATASLCVAYKPNIAFYEAQGLKGWRALKKTIEYLNANYPEIFTIADAKRGDIGNTSKMYAQAFFEELNFDSVTIAPYMGQDSVEPFLEFENKYAILLALTSNEGAFDFQTIDNGQHPLYINVLKTSQNYKNAERLMYVVGATKGVFFQEIRKVIPDSFLLVPGVGAQGGDLATVCRYGLNSQIGLLVNSSRGIIYASSGKDFEEIAYKKAKELQLQMAQELRSFSIIP